MNKQARIWIATVAGLALAALLLLAGSATAGVSQPIPHSRIAQDAQGWSSGWITVTPGLSATLNHNLGGDPDDYAVELWFRDAQAEGHGINTRAYGGLEVDGAYYGAYWHHLTSDSIQLARFADDTFADRVRVRVWVPDPLPDYCSSWTPIGLGETLTFSHGLGGDVDDYGVRMTFSSTLSGITHFAFGGLEFNDGGTRLGAFWHNLTTSTVQVSRYPGGLAAQVRVCVTIPDPPDYDSGWVTVTQGTTTTFDHELKVNPNLLGVRLSAKSSEDNVGINGFAAGGLNDKGNPRGFNWENLTANSVNVVRYADDEHASQVRVRIWSLMHKVYLPLALRD
jgi:hypothetical protein